MSEGFLRERGGEFSPCLSRKKTLREVRGSVEGNSQNFFGNLAFNVGLTSISFSR